MTTNKREIHVLVNMDYFIHYKDSKREHLYLQCQDCRSLKGTKRDYCPFKKFYTNPCYVRIKNRVSFKELPKYAKKIEEEKVIYY